MIWQMKFGRLKSSEHMNNKNIWNLVFSDFIFVNCVQVLTVRLNVMSVFPKRCKIYFIYYWYWIIGYSDWVIFRYICEKPVHKSRFNCCKLDSFVILIWLDSDIYLIRSLENRLRWVNSGIRTLSLSSLYLIHSVFSSRSFTISHMICQRIDHVICPFNAMILVLNTFSYPIPIWYQLIPHS